MIKNFIFDLDGTLIDSSQDIIDCIKGAYAFWKYQGIINIDKSVIGLPIREIVWKITPKLGIPMASSIEMKYRELYDNSSYPNTTLCKGVDMIRSLLERSYLLTNKPKRATNRILRKFQLGFKEVACIDSYPIEHPSKEKVLQYLMKEYQLNPDETVLIGDTQSDIDAATKNNIQCFLVYAKRSLLSILDQLT